MDSKKVTVTVVPPENKTDSGASLCQGTRVVLPDGTELGLVTRIELVAEINDLWRGTIELMPSAGVMKGMRVSLQPGKPSWWRTMLCRMAGVVVDTTSLEDQSRRWRKP